MPIDMLHISHEVSVRIKPVLFGLCHTICRKMSHILIEPNPSMSDEKVHITVKGKQSHCFSVFCLVELLPLTRGSYLKPNIMYFILYHTLL